MNGRCFSNIASRTCATGAFASNFGVAHWIRPQVTFRAMDGASEPAGDHGLPARVEVDRGRAVRLQVAEERGLASAERKEGHRRGDADVDADHARRRPRLELARVPAAR